MGDVTAIAQYTPPAALAKPLEWTPEQRKMIRDTYASGANDSEFSMLMQIASVRNLDPIKRQIWFVKRWDSMKRCEVWAPQTSIDGLRTIAQRTGLYDGQDEPEFLNDKNGRLEFCRVKVYRKDWNRPAVGIAYWSEYAAKKKDGSITAMWSEKPHVMLAKCAEALGLRKAFPEDTAGLYVPEEMAEKDVTPQAVQPSPAARERAAKVLAKAATVDVSPNAEAALMVAIGNAANIDALKALVPHFRGLAADALDRLRAAYGERQRALKAAAAPPPEPRKSAEEIAAEEQELAEYSEEVDARTSEAEVMP